MKVMVILVVIGELETIPKYLLKEVENLKRLSRLQHC